MTQNNNNKKILIKGLKTMGISLPLFFLSPYILTLAFLNKDNFSFYIFFSLGLILFILTIYLFYKGIKTIMKSLF
ncbi:MAG: DUF6095 family protein [Flavobacteriales bacterium]